MTVDSRALPWEVFIDDGSTQLDCTEARVSLLLKAQPWDQSGWWEMKGTLVLAAGVEGFAESLDRRANPSRLAEGNAVYVDVDFGAPTGKIRLPWALQITGNCNRPNVDGNPVISVPVGSVRSAKNYGSPEGQPNGIPFGSSFTERGALINAMLAEVGAGTLIDSISEYPLNYAPQKVDRSSWMDPIGKMAATVGKAVWQANGGAIRASTLTLDGLSPITHLEVGSNEADYRHGTTTDNPPRTVRVSGTGFKLNRVQDTEVSFPIEQDGEDIGEVTIKTQGFDTYTHVTTETHRKRRKDVLPDLFPGDNRQFNAYRKVTTKVYSTTDETLEAETILEERPRAQALGADVSNPLVLTDDTRTIITPDYDSKKVLKDRTTLVEEPGLQVNPSTSTVGSLVPASLVAERWDNQGNGNYSYTRSPFDFRENAVGRPARQPSGNGRPPATQYRPSPTTKEELLYQGEATFDTGTPGKPWNISVTGGLIVSDRQAYDYAYLWGRIRQGRAWPIQWKAQLTAAWLQNFSPLQRIDATYKGQRTAYLVDGFMCSLGPDYSEVGGSGLEIGQVATSGGGTPATVYKSVATATINGSLPSPSGSINIAVGAHPVTINGSLPSPSGSVNITPRAWAVTINGSLPSPGGSVSVGVKAGVTINGSLPSPGGAIVVEPVAAVSSGTVSNINVRHAVQAAPLDAQGHADWLQAGTGLAVDSKDISASNPLILAWTLAPDSSGAPQDLLAKLTTTAPAWTGLLNNTDNQILYIDNDGAGNLSYVHNTLVPHYGTTEPGSPATGQWHYNILHTGPPVVWDGSEWVETNRLPVGEADTDSGAVVDLRSYATQGLWLGGDTVALSDTYNYAHNIGVEAALLSFEGVFDDITGSAGGGGLLEGSGGYKIGTGALFSSTHFRSSLSADRLFSTLKTGNGGLYHAGLAGYFTGARSRILVRRAF